jgi:predicted alpha-1,2-mannosidase
MIIKRFLTQTATAFTWVIQASFLIAQTPAQYVNPFIGTGGHGHTFPGATVPFGMVQLSPDTRIDGSWDGCGGYHYSDSVIYGFSHTHLSGTGVSDYGDILLMPLVNKSSFSNKEYSSVFSHSDETAEAGYYSVLIHNKKVKVELTASPRTGFHRYIFNETGTATIILDLEHRDKAYNSELEVHNNGHVSGYRFSDAWAKQQMLFFDLQFSREFAKYEVECNEEFLTAQPPHRNRYKDKIKVAFHFNINKGDTLLVKCALSSVSESGAWHNMESEIPHWNFDVVRKQAFESWNKELSRIELKGGAEHLRKIFYTALYHCMIAPNIYNDVKGHYRGRDLQIYQTEGHDYYTVFSLWDTFRALHPLLTIIDKKRTLDFIRTMLLQYQQGGLLPVWELAANETECMIGYHSVPVIADAAFKDVNDFDKSLALEAMRKSAESKHRYGLGAYMRNGFLSAEDEHESVSKTLEYAYDDWCISRFALHLGDTAAYKTYSRRAQYWKNLFNPYNGFITPRENGNFLSPFDPYQVNNNYTEANGWQYNFFVPHDMGGMISKLGGMKNFEKKLDELFTAQDKTTGRQQADITGLIGQYAHGNEPSHHVAYLYNYAAAPWKTQQRVRQIMDEFYKNTPDGLIGNEDCGQMSAWFVMSAIGFYPVTPASDIYVIGSPLFDEVKIKLENGKSFIIKAENQSPKNIYIQSATLNGKPYFKSYFTYDDLKNGGELKCVMGNKPNETFGTTIGNVPVQEMKEPEITQAPLIRAESKIFKDSLTISIESLNKNDKIFYTLTQNDSAKTTNEYKGPFQINQNTTVSALAVAKAGKSGMAIGEFYKLPHPERIIRYVTPYSSQYTAGGDWALLDGIRGDENWRKGNWQGFHQMDMEVIIDLGAKQTITHVSAGFLKDTKAWIFLPKEVKLFTSADGLHFEEAAAQPVEQNEKSEEVIKQTVTLKSKPIQTRFIKLKATNYGKLPEWHLGYEYNGYAWIFCDEITVE